MQAEAWTTLGVGLTTLGGIGGVWLSTRAQGRRVEGKVDTAASVAAKATSAAAEAAQNTQHVANGFAAGTSADLQELLAGQRRMEELQRQQAEISGRTVARLDDVAHGLSRHVDDHLHGLFGPKIEGGS
jgi:hypothetical protein